jgi:hypothetical protein
MMPGLNNYGRISATVQLESGRVAGKMRPVEAEEIKNVDGT